MALLLLNGYRSWGQDEDLTSLKSQVDNAKTRTEQFESRRKLANYYRNNGDIEAYGAVSKELLRIAYSLDDAAKLVTAYGNLGNYFANKSDFHSTLTYYLKALPIAERLNDADKLLRLYNNVADQYRNLKNYQQALLYLRKTQLLLPQVMANSPEVAQYVYINFCETYLGLNNSDSALRYIQLANEEFLKNRNDQAYVNALYDFGLVYDRLGKADLAESYFRKSIALADSIQDVYNYTEATKHYSVFLFKHHRYEEVKNFALQSMLSAKASGNHLGIISASELLHETFLHTAQKDSALHYLMLKDKYRDSVFNEEQLYKIQQVTFNEQSRLQEIESAKVAYQNRVKMYVLLAAILALLIIGLLLWRNIRNRKKAYRLLERQKQEIANQKRRVEEAYAELKSTQAQLIQREKMASLGELTAGIAHEIQNPLNFINNFSDVNLELIEEMRHELEKGNAADALEIFNDVNKNLEKISYHGKRADNIIKNMLQHSRKSTGTKEAVNINELAKEYLLLSYHGLRAKDKSFNAGFETSFDESLETIEAIPQDIGRVLLNLYNNAFYAVNEKRKQANDNYQPTVSVSTKKIRNAVEIQVKDNGMGVSQSLLDKIFQPFFTTKPAGEGTGLGLSLSYDIITKLHNGELKIDTKEGEYTNFKIIIPVRSSQVPSIINV